MIDPPRAAVPDAVGKCRSAGIKVGGGDKQKNSPRFSEKNFFTKFTKKLFPYIHEEIFLHIYENYFMNKYIPPHLWKNLKIKIHRFTKNLSPTLHFFPHIYKKPVPHINEQTIEPNLPKNYFTAFMKINI